MAAILGRLTLALVVKMVDFPGLPPGGHIFDWLEARDAIEPDELRRRVESLADAAEPIQPKRPRSQVERFRPFPVDALPGPVCSFVAAGAKAIGCDLSYVALPMLTALAAAISATRRIELKPGWAEPCVIWTATVGEIGTLKSPATGLALGALQRLQAWGLEEYPELLEQYGRDMVPHEADLAHWKKKGRGAGEPLPARGAGEGTNKKGGTSVERRHWRHDVGIQHRAIDRQMRLGS